MKAIPDDVLEELKKLSCNLKGLRPRRARAIKWPNIESANVAMAKGLDLFANFHPVKVP